MKQFTLRHDRSALKVGTDGVLLAATVAALLAKQPPTHILDIGAGSGLITLMLAQAFQNAIATGIEIDKGSYLDAEENRLNSPFAERITLHHQDFLEWTEEEKKAHFDLIVSNPPFFTETHQAKEPNKTLAKHIDRLTPKALFTSTQTLFNREKEGRLALIFPTNQADRFYLEAEKIGLQLKERILIAGKVGKAHKREIALWSTKQTDSPFTQRQIDILQSDQPHHFTDTYKDLLSPYLTIF